METILSVECLSSRFQFVCFYHVGHQPSVFLCQFLRGKHSRKLLQLVCLYEILPRDRPDIWILFILNIGSNERPTIDPVVHVEPDNG